jgi:iron complex outermembrane receptor protein
MNTILPSPAHRALFAVGLLFLPLSLCAQSPSAAAPTLEEKAASEMVVLSPFQVTSDQDDGYYSPASVSGTRTRTELVNLPLSMTVFNEQLLKDVGANNLIDVVGFASGVSIGSGQATGEGDDTSFTLRGMVGFVPMRNGFRRLRVAGAPNIDRVEILKGPSSMLYGQLNPGGSVNYITKRPLPNRKVRTVTTRIGSYDFYQGTLDANEPIVPGKLALRFVGSITDAGNIQERYYNQTTLLNPSLTWWIKPETTLTVEFEQTDRNINGWRGALPYDALINFEDRPLAVTREYNTAAPGDFNDTQMKVYTAEFIHRFNRNLVLRANGTQAIWFEHVRQNGGATGFTDAAKTILNRRGITYQRRGSWDKWQQYEFVNNFEVKGVEVQNIVGYQNQDIEFRVERGPRQVTTSPTVQWNLTDPSTWFITQLTEADTAPSSDSGRYSTTITKSWYVTNQLSLLDGKVRTLAGMRWDKFNQVGFNPAGNPQITTSKADPAKVPQIGVLVKPIKGLSAYAAYSESFLPIFSSLQYRPDGTQFQPVPQSGKGWDIGVRGELAGGKFVYSAAIFEIENTNIIRQLPTITLPDGSIVTPAVQNGVEASEGFEADIRYRPTKGTQLIASYGYTDAYIKSDIQTRATLPSGEIYLTREGHWLRDAPRHTFSFLGRHSLGDFGAFKGVYMTASGRYVSERVSTETYNIIAGVPTAPPAMKPYTVFDLGTGANFKFLGHNYSASLIVKNIFDKIYLPHRFSFGAPREFQFTLTARF